MLNKTEPRWVLRLLKGRLRKFTRWRINEDLLGREFRRRGRRRTKTRYSHMVISKKLSTPTSSSSSAKYYRDARKEEIADNSLPPGRPFLGLGILQIKLPDLSAPIRSLFISKANVYK